MQATSRSVSATTLPPRYAGCRGCCTSTSKCVAGPGVSGVSSQRHGWHPTWWTWFHFSAFWGSISTFCFEFPLVKMGQKTPQAIWITIEMVNLPLGERSSYTFAAQFKPYFFKDPFVGKVCGFLRRQDQEVTKSHVNLHFFVGPRLVKKTFELIHKDTRISEAGSSSSPTPFFRFHVKNQTRKPRVSLVFLVVFSRFLLKSTIAYPQPTHESSTGSPRMKR